MPALTSKGRAPFRAAAHGRRPTRALVTTVGAVAVAAAAVAVVLGIGLVRADNTASNLQSARGASSSTVNAALHAPGHRLVTLDSGSHAALAQVVVVPSGQGYLVSSKLPSLGDGRTYQLWAIEGKQPISLGLLGGFAAPGGLHHGRLDASLAPGNHGRTGGRVRPADGRRSSPPGPSDAAAQLLGSHLMSEEDAPKTAPADRGRRRGRADQAGLHAAHARRAPPGPRGGLQPLVRAGPLLLGLHGGSLQLRRAPLRRHRRPQGAARPGPVGHHRASRAGGPTSRPTGCSTATSTCGTNGRCAR